MVNKALKTIKTCWKNFLHCSLGFVAITGLFIISIFSLPIFLYRWIVCQVLAPLFGKDLGKAVSVASSFFATELDLDKGRSKPRCAIVVNFVFDGSVKFEDLRDLIYQNWITAVDPTTGKLKYPEFHQFIGSWMGYLFWKQDQSFSLDKHVSHHECKDSWTEMDCEKYVCSLSEDLLNKPFPRGRSPWEGHLISNFRNSEPSNGGKKMTQIVFRFHHCMADGYGMFSALVEGLLKIPLTECEVAAMKPSKPKSKLGDPPANISCFRQILNFARYPIKIMKNVGYAISITLMPVRTPFFIPEDKRTGLLLYITSEKVPISKLKFVKDTFGVSFTATMLSSIGAGIASSNRSKGFPNRIKKLPFGSPLPLNDHPSKLRNHVTAALYDVSIDQTLSPLERLKQCERHYQTAKKSTYPYITPLALKLAAAQLPIISRFLLTNRTLSTAMTNFPGPGVPLNAFNGQVVETNFAAGILMGVAGVGFMVLSYHDHVRISIVAENAALERHELQELSKSISDEIDILYELAKRDNDVKICMTDEERYD